MASANPPLSQRPIHVLVAEDDNDMRMLLCAAFQKEGYLVDEVEDGFELRDYLEACLPLGRLPQPDVIVSDIRMPGCTALEVLTKFDGMVSQVVLITAFGDAATHQRARMLGVTAVLDKPVDLDVIRETVRRMLHAP